MPKQLVMRSALLLTAAAMVACSAEPTQKNFTVAPGLGLTTDASLRVMTMTAPGAGSVHGRVNPASMTCTEPSPDVASALVNALSLAVKADAAKGPFAGGVGVGTSFSSSQQIAQLAERTVAVQVLREAFWRACEAYANGGINEINYSLLLARIPETMATLRYGELAGGDFGRSLATIGTSGETTSSAQGSAEGKLSDELAKQAATKLEESEKATRDAQRDVDRSLTEKRDLERKVAEKSEQVERQKDEIKTAPESAVPALERQLSETRREERAESAKLAEKSNEVVERQRKLDETRSENRKRLEEAKVAQQVATSAKASGTAQAAGGISNSAAKDVATVLKDMHRDFLRDDFNSDSIITACLIALSNPTIYGTLAQQCGETGVLNKLAGNILEKRQTYILQVSRNLNSEVLARTSASATRDGAKKARADACRASLEKAGDDATLVKEALAICKAYAAD